HPAREVRETRPHFVAVDHPLIALPFREGLRAGEVGPGAGFAEALTPDLICREERRQEPALLLFGPVVKDRRGGHAEADHVDEVGHAGTRDFGAGDPLEALVPAAAIFLRIVTGDQPRLVHRLLPRAEVGTLLLGHHLDGILRQTKRRWCRTVL